MLIDPSLSKDKLVDKAALNAALYAIELPN
jgi:hypothetical protein